MKKCFIILTLVFSILLQSCQKDADLQGITTGETSPNNKIDLTGMWKFVNAHAKTIATNESVESGSTIKTVTTSDYTTENNTGTVVFNGQNMSYDSLSYSINTIAYVTTYENGNQIDTASIPIQAAFPVMKGESAYTAIGSDSLYFQGGGSMFAGGSQPAKPAGVKIKREQDKLYFTQRVAETNATTDQGLTVKSTQEAVIITTFQKL